jgi:hypothetical protein
MLPSRILLHSLRQIEQETTCAIAADHAPARAMAVIDRAIARLGNLSTEGVDEQVLGLHAELQENFRQGVRAYTVLGTLKESGEDALATTVTTLTRNDVSQQESNYARKIAGEVKVSLGGSGPRAQVSVTAQRESSERKAAEENIRETITRELKSNNLGADALNSIIQYRVGLIAWRGMAEALRRNFPAPPDYSRLIIEARGHHARCEWADADAEASRAIALLSHDLPEVADMKIIRFHSLCRMGSASAARQQLVEFMDQDRASSVSRPLNILLGYMLLEEGKLTEAISKFDDCCRGLGMQEDEPRSKLLGYHAHQAELGKAAALLANNQEQDARWLLAETLKNNTSSQDKSLLLHVRATLSTGPAQEQMKRMADLTEVKISNGWVTRRWVSDDLGLTNASAFTLNNVRISVWGENENGDKLTEPETVGTLGSVAPGAETGRLTSRWLVRTQTKRVMVHLQSDEGEFKGVLKE